MERRMGKNNKFNFEEELDSELLAYLDEAGIIPRKKASKPKKLKSSLLAIGENIVYKKDNYGTVIFGPYNDDESQDKMFYEIEMEDGQILTIEDGDKNIQIYVPEVIEEDDDNIF